MFRVFDRISPEDQLDMIRTALPLADQSEDLFATMTNSYFREAHREIWEFGRLQTLNTHGYGTDPAKAEADLALMEDVLINTSRNRCRWMEVACAANPPTTRPVSSPSARVTFPAIRDLLNLLKQDGWTLTRQPSFDTTGQSQGATPVRGTWQRWQPAPQYIDL